MAEDPQNTEGPICKVCGRPMNKHSFVDQKKCQKEGEENGFN